MDLEQIRNEIDAIDKEMVKLFDKRMDCAANVAKFKKENNLPVLNSAREREILNKVTELADEDHASYLRVLYSLMFELSRTYQGKILNTEAKLFSEIKNAVENTPNLFPTSAVIACQGVEGAYSQLACEKVFKNPNIMYFNNFEGVFAAIDQGFCKYGIIPIENSTAGSVNNVYDLMIKYNFSIVKTARIKVDHNLLAKKGTKLTDIKEIFSHEQAISQCAEFLATLPNVKVTCCENTAVAAQMVANSDRTDIAALSSRACSELYNLNVIKPTVNDKQNNTTRFICISKNLEIYPGSDKTSIMMILPHKPGSLYKVLARFYALGINLIKLESRPLPEREFEFMFYFDLETSIYSDEFAQLMCELEDISEEFKYLGSYTEIV